MTQVANQSHCLYQRWRCGLLRENQSVIIKEYIYFLMNMYCKVDGKINKFNSGSEQRQVVLHGQVDLHCMKSETMK